MHDYPQSIYYFDLSHDCISEIGWISVLNYAYIKIRMINIFFIFLI